MDDGHVEGPVGEGEDRFDGYVVSVEDARRLRALRSCKRMYFNFRLKFANLQTYAPNT